MTSPARRQKELIELFAARNQLSVDELSAHFSVSDDTIRRDLQILEERKIVLRTHGGAVSTGFLVNRETTFSMRGKVNQEAKARIARAAAELISDGETLLINGGSSTFNFVASLGARRGLTIVTNNIAIAPILPPEAIADLYFIGGHYRPNLVSTIGSVKLSAGEISVDTAIIGVTGLTAEKGLSTTVLEEAVMFAEMIEAAGRTIVLADSSKFDRNGFGQFAHLDEIDILVTDSPPPPNIADALQAAQVEIIIATE
jgi:DeoR family transcriptional regulator, fructose operon transcriptional repressor